MKKELSKKFKVRFFSSNYFDKSFTFIFDDYMIRINNMSINQFCDYLKDALNNKFIKTDDLTIEEYNVRDVTLLKDNNADLKGCVVCQSDAPIYKIKGEDGYLSALFICKEHLEQLIKYIERMLSSGNVSLYLDDQFEVEFS